MSTDFLATMAASSRARVAAARRVTDEAELLRLAGSSPRPVPLTLSPQGFDVIAEVKLRSPALGQLKGGDETLRRAWGVSRQVRAVSLLTEPTFRRRSIPGPPRELCTRSVCSDCANISPR